MRNRLLLTTLLLIAVPAAAQNPRFVMPLDSAAVSVTTNVQYGTSDTTILRMDVFRPRAARTPAPILIFFNRAVGAGRSNPFYRPWAMTAAARGMVSILPDLRDGKEAHDLRMLLAHLQARAGESGGDPNAIAVYAASGNAYTALPVLQDPSLTSVKAAIIYYGAAPVTTFRLDLPVLLVRAGLDRPALNREIDAIALRAVAQNAPLTLLNHAGGYHGFEFANDDDATRAVIQQTVAFAISASAPTFRSAILAGMDEARAAGFVVSGNFAAAAEGYRTIVASQPDNARLRLSYGEALLGASQFGAACDEFEKLKGKGLGPRDLGLPAARACLQKGDPDAAIAWLKSIPTRFLPPSVRQEPVFAPLRNRADFVALFPD